MKLPEIISSFSLVILLAACGGNEGIEQKESRPEFRTTPPSLLYFKNIRSVYYESEEQPGTRIERYRLRKFATDAQRPILYPLIANNWLQDEAYLLLAPNKVLSEVSDPLKIIWKSGNEMGVLAPANKKLPHQYSFAKEISDRLRAGASLYVVRAPEDTLQLFADFEDRTNFQTTLRDYEKLTERR